MRRLLGLAVGAAAALVAAAISIGLWTYTSASTTVTHGSYPRALRIPPLLDPTPDATGTKRFDLRLQAGTTDLLPGKPAATWGVNGAHLGPTLRARRGDRVSMRVRNALPESTTVHWHGMHLPAAADGGPHQPIEPGAVWSPSWTIDQPAATLWYHPHPHERTADQVYRGLAGMFLLDDPQADRLALPGRYGVDDIPLIVQDKRLNDEGELDFGQAMISPIGRLGSTVLVNGTYRPHLVVRTQRIRLRLLNASTARFYDFAFDDSRSFDLVSTDGGLLDAPKPTDHVQLSPGERAEVVVSVRPGERVVLRSDPPDLGTNAWEGRFSGADDRFDLLELRAADVLESSPAVPARLVDPPELADDASGAPRRTFELSSRRINDRRMDMGRIDQTVPLDTTERWHITNGAGIPHNFHVHDARFEVLAVDGRAPSASLSGWKDTIAVLPRQRIEVAIRFTDYADPDVPYMFHCHLLQHEDRGMMGQFVVVQRGQQATQPSVAIGSAHDDRHDSSGAPEQPEMSSRAAPGQRDIRKSRTSR